MILTPAFLSGKLYKDSETDGKKGDYVEIILSSSSDKPIYEQITSQIKEMIMKGELKPGEAMPSMRKLAKSLHVSVITTQRAYDDLQRDGFIITVPAKGTFVSTQNQDFIREENLRRIEELLTDAATLGRENGLSSRSFRLHLNLFTRRTNPMQQALVIENLTKRYKDFTLDHISFSLPQGTILGIIGENGSGKSTLINALLGLIPADYSRLELLGKDIAAHPNLIKQDLAVIFDDAGYDENFTPLQIGKFLSHVYKNWDADSYRSYLKRFDLPAKKRLKTFSGNENQAGVCHRVQSFSQISDHG